MLATLRDTFGEAWRRLARQPALTAAAVATLALGLGVNTALFAIADAVLLRSLPVRSPEQLVLFQWTSGPNPALGYLTGEWWQEADRRIVASSFSHPAFVRLRSHPEPLRDVFACADARQRRVTVDGRTEPAAVQLVSGEYFPALGVNARHGRTIGPDDDRAGQGGVAVVSHRYWHRRFGGRPDAVGRTVHVEGRAVPIVGIAPRGFTGTMQLGSGPDLWLPLAARDAVWPRGPRLDDGKAFWLQVMARQPAGVSRTTAEAALARQLGQALEESGVSAASPDNLPRLRLSSGRQGLAHRRHEQREPLLYLGVVAGLLHVLACISVAGLLATQRAARQRELGIRLALGAPRASVGRQLLAEGVLLGVVGGVASVAIATWTARALAAGLLAAAPDVGMDARVLVVCAGLTLLTAAAVGLVPALDAARVDVARELSAGRSVVSRTLRLDRALVVLQVALSLSLLAGAGLLLRTVWNLTHVRTGFATESLYLFRVDAGDLDAASVGDRTRRLLERLAAESQVDAIGAALHHPLDGRRERERITLDGRPALPDNLAIANVNAVAGDFFAALRIPVHRGRALDSRDGPRDPSVAVVNEAFARRYFPGEDPVGRRVSGRAIVGVVGDTIHGDLREGAPPMLFVSLFQERMGPASFCIRARDGVRMDALAARVREALREVDPAAALAGFTSAGAELERAAQQERMAARLAGLFAILAVLLASVGLYASMAERMARRTREIGVRMALGATRADIVRLVLVEGVGPALAGCLLGLAGAAAAARLIEGLLFGVSPLDPRILAGAAAVLLVVAVLACGRPARRAAQIDPAAAIRQE